jgi:hypothetical protein
MAKKSKKARGIITYKSYMFREKDPIIDALRTAVSEAQVSGTHKTYTILSNASGVSTTTLHGWFHGKTRRPQFATTAAVGRALGKKGVVWTANGCKLID